jgi:hypothetical protein
MDYGRAAWKKTLAKCRNNQQKIKIHKLKFRKEWYTGGVFVEWLEDHPQ